MSFLEHDMSPLDPLELKPKRGVPQEPVIRKPQYREARVPRYQPETSITVGPKGKFTHVNHFAAGAQNLDGSTRDDSRPSSKTGVNSEPVDADGPNAVLFGAGSASRKPVRKLSTDTAGSGASTMSEKTFKLQKLNLHDDMTPAKKEHLEKLKAELHYHEQRQKEEKQALKKTEKEIESQPIGWVLDRSLDFNEKPRDGKIERRISRTDKYSDTTLNGKVQKTSRRNSEVKEDQQQTKSRRQSVSNPEDKSFEDVIVEKRTKQTSRISREITARDPRDQRQINKDMKESRKFKTEEYRQALEDQMKNKQDPLESMNAYKPGLNSGKNGNSQKSKKVDPSDVPIVGDNGKIDGLYKDLTKESETITDKLGKQKGPVRVRRELSEEDQERVKYQQEQKAALDELMKEKEQLKALQAKEEAELRQAELQQYPLNKKSGAKQTKPKSELRKDANIPKEVLEVKQKQKDDYARFLKEQREIDQAKKMKEAHKEKEEINEAFNSDHWKWNDDLLKHQPKERNLSNVTQDDIDGSLPEDVREYRVGLRKQLEEQERIAHERKKNELEEEKNHLDNSFDVRFEKRKSTDKTRPKVMPSIKRTIFADEEKNEPSSPKKDHLKQIWRD